MNPALSTDPGYVAGSPIQALDPEAWWQAWDFLNKRMTSLQRPVRHHPTCYRWGLCQVQHQENLFFIVWCFHGLWKIPISHSQVQNSIRLHWQLLKKKKKKSHSRPWNSFDWLCLWPPGWCFWRVATAPSSNPIHTHTLSLTLLCHINYSSKFFIIKQTWLRSASLSKAKLLTYLWFPAVRLGNY